MPLPAYTSGAQRLSDHHALPALRVLAAAFVDEHHRGALAHA